MSKLSDCLLVLVLMIVTVGLGGCAREMADNKIEPSTAGVQPQQSEDTTAKKGGDKAVKKEVAEEGEKKDEKKEKPFEEVVKDFKAIEGLFTLYQKEDEGKVYLEIKPEQFEKIYLCSITLEAAEGYFFDSGAMAGEFPFVFKRVGKKVLFIHKNVYFRADKDSAIHRAVARGVSDSIMGSAKIESKPHPKHAGILVDPSGFYIQDIEMVGYIFSKWLKDAQYALDKDTSYFGVLKSFPKNTEIEAVLNFKGTKPYFMPTVPDSRSFQHVYHYSLSTLPETDYRPRLGDDRVGHFLTMYQDYTSVLRDTPYTRYVSRWHLKKAEPKFKLSPPKKPIVFWLENTTPVAYREAVKEGILVWNKAFEQIGFKDAIVVKQQPDDADWDPADVRYSTVRWIVQPGWGYAVGPSRTNPFTGQIYDADIRVSADIVRYIFQQYEQFANPVAMERLIERSLRIPGRLPHGLCDYQIEAAQQAAFGWNLLSARALTEGEEIDAEQYLHDFLVHLIAHEVGHTLGLRHNFKASSIHSADQIQNAGFTTEHGLTGSLMDYIPVNIAPEGRKQGQYFQTTLGPYDYWAIEYAYKPLDAGGPGGEKAELEKIASRVAEPTLIYGTDEDVLGARGIDPICSTGDLGTDPIAFYRDRVGLVNELWSKMEEKFEKKGNRYQKLLMVFERGLWQYPRAAWNVSKYIGGIYHRRDHVGDPNGRIPFEPVPAARQREALEFLRKNIFGPEAFNFSPELLNKLAPERFWDFEWSVWTMERIDYPIHDYILWIQKLALRRLYHPIVLSRLQDIELRYKQGEEPFTMPEMFEGLRQSIWSEALARSNINSFRRSLQRAHLDRLAQLVVNPPKGVPEDAATLARADLVALNGAIGSALSSSSLDAYTRAHLDETRARIEAVLKASVERRLGLIR